ncbi:MAG TPA: hypothetical protein VGX50_02665 [Longimicrobium sp.]|jgi:hypothetical protein|nr:hypothetical protein [Longimicrobium sp.]
MPNLFDGFRRTQRSQVKFGGKGTILNPAAGGEWYTIQVQNGPALEILKGALQAHNATASAWVSINDGSAPQWVPLSQI